MCWRVQLLGERGSARGALGTRARQDLMRAKDFGHRARSERARAAAVSTRVNPTRLRSSERARATAVLLARLSQEQRSLVEGALPILEILADTAEDGESGPGLWVALPTRGDMEKPRVVRPFEVISDYHPRGDQPTAIPAGLIV